MTELMEAGKFPGARPWRNWSYRRLWMLVSADREVTTVVGRWGPAAPNFRDPGIPDTDGGTFKLETRVIMDSAVPNLCLGYSDVLDQLNHSDSNNSTWDMGIVLRKK
jgi:hypothetical protein